MAIARLSMKVGKTGKAAPHAAYIAREGQYAARLENGEKLEATEAGNMPAWAKKDAQQFWQAADAYERKNGTTYREMEIALPRELTSEQRADVVRDFVRQEIGELHAYQWAIHTPKAIDGGDQPHVHLMFSERQIDGIERDPEQYFKRYNAKAPERGGARKGYGPSAGQTLTAAERADDLKALRSRWQHMCNQHLERAGHHERIDMRSHAERGTGLQPEAKQLPSRWRGEGRTNVIEFRQARRELAAATDQLRQVIPNVQAEIVSLEAERQRRAADRQAAAQIVADSRRETRERAERLRIEQMSAAELVQEISSLRPESVFALIERNIEVNAAESELSAIRKQHIEAASLSASARDEMAAWREKHPVQSWLHDKSPVGHAAYLSEREERHAQANQELLKLAPRLMNAEQRVRSARDQAHLSIHIEQKTVLSQVADLEALHQKKLHQEREAAREMRAAQEKAREILEVQQDFAHMAHQRETGESGWSNTGAEWKAAPEALRELLEAYNAGPEHGRGAVLKQLTEIGLEYIRDAIEEQRQNSRSKDHGLKM